MDENGEVRHGAGSRGVAGTHGGQGAGRCGRRARMWEQREAICIGGGRSHCVAERAQAQPCTRPLASPSNQIACGPAPPVFAVAVAHLRADACRWGRPGRQPVSAQVMSPPNATKNKPRQVIACQHCQHAPFWPAGLSPGTWVWVKAWVVTLAPAGSWAGRRAATALHSWRADSRGRGSWN